MRHALLAAICAGVLAACGANVRAPVQDRGIPGAEPASVSRPGAGQPVPQAADAAAADVYVVQRGDTLSVIGLRYGIDYRDIARWNELRDPSLIFPGQRLRLTPPQATSRVPQAAAVQPRQAPPTTRSPPPAQSARATRSDPTAAEQTRPQLSSLNWRWPAGGRYENAQSALGTSGLRIYGERGQSISATSSGRVVYSGSGLGGYGQLIIIEHDTEFLSVYAHNDRILVEEGAIVSAGQQIAEMGDSDAEQVMLYFEIRRDGVAVEPLQYLPARSP